MNKKAHIFNLPKVDSRGKRHTVLSSRIAGLPVCPTRPPNKTKPGQMVREFATATCQVCGVAKAPPGGIAVTRLGRSAAGSAGVNDVVRKRTASSHVNGSPAAICRPLR